MIVLYTPEISSRIQYTFKLVFLELLGVNYEVTSNSDHFVNNTDLRINYSLKKVENSLHIVPSGLLTDTGIKEWDPKPGEWQGLPTLFADERNAFPFDLFSAVFYLVSRYEEYLPFKSDKYSRFEADQSYAFHNHFLRLPIVDLWCKKLAGILNIEYQCSQISVGNYRFRLTVDIDQPWLYRNKGIIHTAGSLLRELLRLNFKQMTYKLDILSGRRPDPAETYELIDEVQTKLDHPVSWFLLCRNAGKFDVNRSAHRNIFHRLARKLDRSGSVGIHPSYKSSASVKQLFKEVDYLSGVLKRDLMISRQHFLRLSLPDTYRNLIKTRIREDYSMGYASQTGFRAGIARSFNFFDLPMNKETSLRVVPFQIMDQTLLSYMKLSTDEAIREFDYYTQVIRSIGGEFVCLWHNDSLSNQGEWEGWQKVFLHMIDINSGQ